MAKEPVKKATTKPAASDELVETKAAGTPAKKAPATTSKVTATASTKTTTKAPAKKSLTSAQQKSILEGKTMPADAIQDTITSIENVKGAEAVPLVKQMLESNDFNEFKIGGLLSVIDVNGYWRDHGYQKFRDFIEGFYGIKYRKAMYLTSIYNSLVESGVEWDQVKELGWTKLKEICAFLTPDNVEKWVELAKGMTVIALIEYLKTCDENGDPKDTGTGTKQKGTNPTETPEVSTMTFKVHNTQREVIREALDKAKKDADTEYDNVALEHIAMQYLQGSLGKKAPAKAAKQLTLQEQVEAMVAKDGDEALEPLLTMIAEHYPEYDIQVSAAEEAGEDEAEE